MKKDKRTLPADSVQAASGASAVAAQSIEDPIQYLLSQRRFYALPEIEKHLNAKLATMQHGLIALLNEHFSEFIHLSKDMQTVDQKVREVEEPLIVCQEWVTKTLKEMEHWKEEVQTLCERTLELRLTQQTTRMYLNCYLDLKQLAYELSLVSGEDTSLKSLFKDILADTPLHDENSRGSQKETLNEESLNASNPLEEPLHTQKYLFAELLQTLQGNSEEKQVLDALLKTFSAADSLPATSSFDMRDVFSILSIESDKFLTRYVVYSNVCSELHRLEVAISGMRKEDLDRPIQPQGMEKIASKATLPLTYSLRCILTEARAFQNALIHRLTGELKLLLILLVFAHNDYHEATELMDGFHTSQFAQEEGVKRQQKPIENAANTASTSTAIRGAAVNICEALCLAISNVCKGLIELQEVSVVEDAFYEVLIAPIIKKALVGVDAADLKYANSDLRQKTMLLPQFLEYVSHMLLSEDRVLSWLVSRLTNPYASEFMVTYVPSLHIYSFVVGKHLLQSIEANFPSLFLPVNPKEFVVNYKTMKRFLNQLNRGMNESECKLWNNSSALQKFDKKWKTQIYFSMVRTNKLMILENVWVYPDGFSEKYYLNKDTTVEVLSVILDIFDEGSFLEACYSSALRFAAEIFSKYTNYIQSVSHHIIRVSATVETDSEAQQTNLQFHSLGYVVSDVLTVLRWISVGNKNNARNSETASVVKGELLKHITLSLERSAQEDTSISKTVPSENTVLNKLIAILSKLFEELSIALEEVVAEMKDYIVQTIVEEATQQFVALKSIPKTYILTRRDIPQKPSPYVDSIVLCITSAFGILSTIISYHILHEWTLEAINALSIRYKNEVEELIQTVKQEQHYLKRLQKQDRMQSNQADSMKDFDKILLQIKLDALRFEECCSKELDVTATSSKLNDFIASVKALCHDIVYPSF